MTASGPPRAPAAEGPKCARREARRREVRSWGVRWGGGDGAEGVVVGEDEEGKERGGESRERRSQRFCVAGVGKGGREARVSASHVPQRRSSNCMLARTAHTPAHLDYKSDPRLDSP